MTTLIDINDARQRVAEPLWLARAETVHRQLRPHLPADYVGTMQAILSAGAHMTVAVDGERVLGVAVWRVLLKTSSGRELYVDDLVTDDAARSTGVGAALIAGLDARGRALDCDTLALDSGTQRHRAHRFYFREGFAATAFHFTRSLRG